MNKLQRKRLAAEKKRQAKAARRAKQAEGNTNVGGPSPAVSDTPTANAGETDRPQRSRPDVHSLEDEVHMAYGKMHRAEAEVIDAGTAEMLGDDEAAAMLARAARSLDGVIGYIESVLKRLPAAQLAEALAIRKEPPREGENSRRGPNPAVQLLNLLMRAKNLLVRVIRQTNPNLAKRMKAS